MPLSTDWFIAAGTFVAYGVAMLLFLRRQRRGAVGVGASCGACGYPRLGLPGPVCPECGNDFRFVGLRLPTWWNRRSPQLRRNLLLAAWTLGVAWAAGLSWSPFSIWIQPGIRGISDAVDVPSNNGPYVIHFERTFEGRSLGWWNTSTPGSDWPLIKVAIWLNEQGTFGGPPYDLEWLMRTEPWLWIDEPVFAADIVSSRFGYCVPDGPPGRESDPCKVLRVLHTEGEWRASSREFLEVVAAHQNWPLLVDEVDAVLDAVLTAPYDQLRRYLPAGFARGAGCGRRFDWRPDERFLVPLLAVWLLVWWIGRPRSPHATRVSRTLEQDNAAGQ